MMLIIDKDDFLIDSKIDQLMNSWMDQ